MAIFEYKGRDASDDVTEAYQLARVSQVNAFGGLSLLVDNPLLAAFSGPDYNTDFDLPSGWRDLTPAELGIDPALFDALGVYSSPTNGSAQVKITGKFENGQVTDIAVAFAGTSDFGDIGSYFELEDQRVLNDFVGILDATAAFAQSGGLTGADVTVTGYSLGGAITNALSFRAEDFSGGFFADADYFAFASPTIYDAPARILNLGMENDVVFRSVGDVDATLADGLWDAAINDDKPFAASADNIVLYEDAYANPLFPLGFFSLLNITNGWAAHVRGVFETPWTTIANATFYDDIHLDSSVVISALSPLLRATTWVSDAPRITSDHYSEDAFILGTNAADKLRDGDNADALDGFGGNDDFDLSTGNDRVAGGSGTDRVYVDGYDSSYNLFRLSNGTVYLEDDYYGLKELTDVEHITFTGHLVDRTYTIETGEIDSWSWFVSDKGYAAKIEGHDGDDTLSGGNGTNAIFGRAGNDLINGNGGWDILAGGQGDDQINGGSGDDRIYGGAGNDHLIAGAGNDTLSGDTGDDIFDFSSGINGTNTITDFDSGAWDGDVITLAADDFASASAARNALSQYGNDAILATNTGLIRFDDIAANILTTDDFIIV